MGQFLHQIQVVFPFKIKPLFISLLLLFITSFFTQQPFFTQGLSIPQQNEGQEEMKLIRRALIGSRPPRCEGKCRKCGHCEAIQVPIVPQHGFPRSHFVHYSSSTPTIAYSRGDGLSNYKPMSWKCKCGNSIFNP